MHRYLTKTTEQIMCPMTAQQSALMVWKDVIDESRMDVDDEDDRMFTFAVEKTNEQEENVTMSPGFQVRY